MQSTSVNDVKIYNLTIGKSLPDWLSSKKKRMLLKSDSALRNRIELIQDLTMPGVSQCIDVSPDGQYIVVTGTYKPRMRCFDTNQLAMKFERCFDSEVIRFLFLSEDYTKLAFLQVDRWLEFHSQGGRYFRIRIPRAGRDFSYIKSTCDICVVGDGRSVNRLNLELGKFNQPIETDSLSLNAIAVNPVHELIVVGGKEGVVEAFDPRCDRRVGRLDTAFNSVTQDTEVDGLPSVSCLSFKDSLHLAVGTTTGQILLYDLRSRKPLVVKDHFYGLPIKKAVFLPDNNLVASMDEKIVKIWSETDGTPFTAIQTPHDLNDLSIVPKTGMMFLANEDNKVQSFYLPSLGPAPKWASFLDRIVEEMEETTSSVDGGNVDATNKLSLYDDYKFVTESQLEELGLEHLIGTNLLRAYMHGFFIDIRLYNKAKSMAEPFRYDEYKKKKIKEQLEARRGDRVVIKSQLPVVNRHLVTQLMKKQGVDVIEDDSSSDEDDNAQGRQPSTTDMTAVKRLAEETAKSVKELEETDVRESSSSSSSRKTKGTKSKDKKVEKGLSLLTDDRFKAMFNNEDFQVDMESEEYKSRLASERFLKPKGKSLHKKGKK